VNRLRGVPVRIAGISLTMVLALSSPGTGQAVQAYRSMAVDRDSLAKLVTVFAGMASRRLAAIEVATSVLAAVSDTGPNVRIARQLTAILEVEGRLAREALMSTDDYERFMQRYEALRSYDQELRRTTATTATLSALNRETLLGNVDILLAPPEIHKIPEVAFVVGASATIGDGTTVGSFEVSTNLLGAGIGTAFDALGAKPMKDYAQDNITVGTAFPFGGSNKLAATIGLGLGGLRLGRFALWPAINIEQVDSADSRVPSTLLGKHPDADKWSSPLISVAISAWNLTDIRERLKKGQLTPIITLGLRLPYFYPDDPFSALAALFSANRSNYDVSGKVKVQIAVFFPLQSGKRLAPLP
jgi:hypothetical protein